MEKNKIDFEFYSEKLFEYRKSKGLSQEVLAEKIGVSRQSIYAWESGKSLPDIENLYRLCEILEITANELTNFNPGQEQKVVTKKEVERKSFLE